MWFNILLILVLIICVITDLKSRKIYNKVIFPTLLLAFISHVSLGGWLSLSFALKGFSIGLAILLIPYLMGGMGAGDVKLLALIGALKGSSFVLYTSIYMAIAGGIIALFLLILHKKLLHFLKSLPYALNGLKYGIKISMKEEASLMTSAYPYGVPIALGAILSMLLEGQVILW